MRSLTDMEVARIKGMNDRALVYEYTYGCIHTVRLQLAGRDFQDNGHADILTPAIEAELKERGVSREHYTQPFTHWLEEFHQLPTLDSISLSIRNYYRDLGGAPNIPISLMMSRPTLMKYEDAYALLGIITPRVLPVQINEDPSFRAHMLGHPVYDGFFMPFGDVRFGYIVPVLQFGPTTP